MRYNLNQVNKGQHLEDLCRRYLELHFSAHPEDATRAGYRSPSTPRYRRWTAQQCCGRGGPHDLSIDTLPLHAAQSCNFDHFLCCSGNEAIKRHCAKVAAMLTEAQGIDERSLNRDQLVDLQIVISQLHLELVTFEKLKPQATNPNYYLPFESLNYLLPSWGTTTTTDCGTGGTHSCVADMLAGERLVALLQRLRAMVYLIRDAPRYLTSPQTILVETALKTCGLFQHFLSNDLPLLCGALASNGGGDDEANPGNFDEILGDLKIASEAACACVNSFASFLSDDVLPRATRTCGCGEEVYKDILKYWHFIDSPDDLLRIGEAHFEQVKEQMEVLAREIDPNRTWKEITNDIVKGMHPKSVDLLDAYMLEIERAQSHVTRMELVSPLPLGEKVIGLHTPMCSVPFTPFGDFLNPPPFAGMGVSSHKGTTSSSGESGRVGVLMLHSVVAMGLSPEKEEAVLRAHDYTWISVIAPHETYPGHHVQALIAQGHPRVLRRFYESPLFYEGWGLYTEELAYETGFFEKQVKLDDGHVISSSTYAKLARLTQLRLRLWRAARVILDVKLNIGMMSFEQCQEFLINEVMFNAHSSMGEVLMYASRPGYAPCYVVGFTCVMKLRAECLQREGTSFSLRHFHDNLLSQGCIPFRLLECLL